VGGTIGVLVIVALITLVLGVMDLGLGQVMQWIVP
jgi:preprotein translocase subunit SecE